MQVHRACSGGLPEATWGQLEDPRGSVPQAASGPHTGGSACQAPAQGGGGWGCPSLYCGCHRPRHGATRGGPRGRGRNGACEQRPATATRAPQGVHGPGGVCHGGHVRVRGAVPRTAPTAVTDKVGVPSTAPPRRTSYRRHVHPCGDTEVVQRDSALALGGAAVRTRQGRVRSAPVPPGPCIIVLADGLASQHGQHVVGQHTCAARYAVGGHAPPRAGRFPWSPQRLQG